MSAQTTFTAGDRAFLDNWIYDYNPSQSQSAPLPSNMVVLRDDGGKNGGLNVAVAKLNDQGEIESVAVVSRGTQFSDFLSHPLDTLADLYVDAEIVVGVQGIARLDSADTFASSIYNQYQSQGVPVGLFGQSLGGSIAEHAAAYIASQNAGNQNFVAPQTETEAALSAANVIRADFPGIDPANLDAHNVVHNNDGIVGPNGKFPGAQDPGSSQVGTSDILPDVPNAGFLGLGAHTPSSFSIDYGEPSAPVLPPTPQPDALSAGGALGLFNFDTGADQLAFQNGVATFTNTNQSGVTQQLAIAPDGQNFAATDTLTFPDSSEFQQKLIVSDNQFKADPTQSNIIQFAPGSTGQAISAIGGQLLGQLASLATQGNIPASLILQAAAITAAAAISNVITKSGSDVSAATLSTTFGVNLAGAVGGYVGSRLGADLAEQLGIPPQLGSIGGGVVGNVAAQQGIEYLLRDVVDVNVGEIPSFTDSLASGFEGAVASFAGTELGSAINDGRPEGASIGSALGGTIGTIIGSEILPGIGTVLGSFIGSFIGDLIGGLFGPGAPNINSQSGLAFSPSDDRYHLNPSMQFTEHGGVQAVSDDVVNVITGAVDGVLDEIGGTVANFLTLNPLLVWRNDNGHHPRSARPAAVNPRRYLEQPRRKIGAVETPCREGITSQNQGAAQAGWSTRQAPPVRHRGVRQRKRAGRELHRPQERG
jgi:hypothetical protein